MTAAKGASPDATVRRSTLGLEEAPATFVLTVLEGPDAGATFTLDGRSPTRVLLGTSPACTIRLHDREVSRRHAALTIAPHHLQFIDLDSTNGTTINGVAIREARLHGGESVRFGSTVLSVQRGAAVGVELGIATSWGRILGESLVMRRLYPLFEGLANADGMVLIEGESGTGKELLAEELHRASKRRDAPFIVLEASSLPTDQLNARLLGTVDETGVVEEAHGGVLFVDEIGNLSRNAQKRLVSLLATNDVRLIAATTRDLDRDVTEGRFDESFMLTLAGGRIELPPLREREGDVALLAKHFWAGVAQETPAPPFPVDLLSRFERYAWPGNLRELRSVLIKRATIGELPKTFLSDNAKTGGHDFITAVIQEQIPFPAARDRVLHEFERRYVETVLARHGGNVGAAARSSGIAVRYFQLVRARHRTS